jgi:hypothetical protein
VPEIDERHDVRPERHLKVLLVQRLELARDVGQVRDRLERYARWAADPDGGELRASELSRPFGEDLQKLSEVARALGEGRLGVRKRVGTVRPEVRELPGSRAASGAGRCSARRKKPSTVGGMWSASRPWPELPGCPERRFCGGREELRKGIASCDVRLCPAGAGRRSIEEKVPEIVDMLEGLIEPVTRGDRGSALRWTLKGTRKLSAELLQHGILVSPRQVGELLHACGYNLRTGAGRMVTAPSAVRERQFELINMRVEGFHVRRVPVISVDTRYTVFAGGATHRGHNQQQESELAAGRGDGSIVGNVVESRARDTSAIARNVGWADDDIERETSVFTVRAIAAWWEHMTRHAHLDSKGLFVTVDGIGGSSGARHWRSELQRFADGSGLTIGVSHFPPGTSKWNRIEHRRFHHVTEGWRNRLQVGRELVIYLIGSARVAYRPEGSAWLRAPAFETRFADDGRSLLITQDDVHGEWNYTLQPHREGSR